VICSENKKEKRRFKELYPRIQENGSIMHIGRLLQKAATTMPNHTALIFEGESISYKKLYWQAVAISKRLIALGIKPHDRVLLLIENCPAFYIGYFGIVQVGAVVVPLNVFLKERELAHIINDAQPALIITSAEFMPLLTSAGVSLPPIITDVESDEADIRDEPFTCRAIAPDAMAALLYTSGTTGLPKGVMLSSTNIMTNVLQGITRFDLQAHDRMFVVLPLFHSFAQSTGIWVPMFIGCTVILVRKIDRRHILQGLEQKPTVFLGVPALYGLLCLLKTAPLDHVRLFISGGDALPDRIRAGFELIYRRKICSGYGLTETSPFVSGSLDEETVPTNNVGCPLIGIDCLIKDEEGNAVARGNIGLVWLKGPNIMLGYYNEPDMTAAVLKDGWFNTGDLAYVDKKGRIVITGRLKDLIIHKGFNIYPPEIENIIVSYPAVLRAAVVGKPDPDAGEVPVAFVQVRHTEPDIEKTLRALCQKNMASYKVPKEFYCSINELPATATGKVDKKKLRQALLERGQ
jgi:long-chain acyl-CoA synthetase